MKQPAEALATFRTVQAHPARRLRAVSAALKYLQHGGANWNTWAPEIARREPAAVGEWG